MQHGLNGEGEKCMRTLGGVVTLALALSFVSCDTASEPEIPDNLNFDAAVVAADGTLEDLQMMHGPRLGLPGIVFPPLPNETDCPAAEGRFHCRGIEREGLTHTRTITYLDAGGLPIVDDDGNPLYDEARTDGIRYEISVVGDISREWWSASIDRQRDLTVTGLLNDNDDDDSNDDGVVKWVGSGTGDVERSRHSDRGELRTYHMVSSSVITDVVVPYPRTETGWPLSGTIERTVTITRTFESGETKTTQRDVTVTFSGDQFVTVMVGDDTFTLDLSERGFGPRKMRDHRRQRFHP
jgi:hypothetical protein